MFNDLGIVKKKEGLYAEAAEYYRKALEIIEKYYGTTHYKLGMYTFNLADVYRKMGNFNAADDVRILFGVCNESVTNIFQSFIEKHCK